MTLRSVRHRGLRRLLEHDDPRYLPPALTNRVRNICEWSVSVSGNWRITFEERGGIVDRLNLEDYH